MSKIDFFVVVVEKSSSKLTKGTILKKFEELFEESIIGIFKKKKKKIYGNSKLTKTEKAFPKTKF